MNDQVDRVRDAFNKLWADTDLGPQVRKKVKELYPDVALPEDAAEPVVAPLRAQLDRLEAENAKMREEREAEKAAAAERSAQQSINDRLDAARKRFNLTEEGFDMMVAHMKETQNYTDAEGAAAWVVQQTPPPKPTGPYLGPQNINLFGTAEKDERFALLHKDPMGAFLDQEFRDFTADPDKYIRDAGFA